MLETTTLCSFPFVQFWTRVASSFTMTLCTFLFPREECVHSAEVMCSLRPWTGLALLILALLLIPVLLLSLLHRWHHTRVGSAHVALSCAVLEHVRRRRPPNPVVASSRSSCHPTSVIVTHAPHIWVEKTGRDAGDLMLFCASCHDAVLPLSPGSTFHACALCGLVAHIGRCSRHLSKRGSWSSCRPLVGNGREEEQEEDHFWVPSSSLYPSGSGGATCEPSRPLQATRRRRTTLRSRRESNSTPPTLSAEDGWVCPDKKMSRTDSTLMVDGHSLASPERSHCVYCGRCALNSIQPFSRAVQEPSWTCSLCNAFVHVACFCEAHDMTSLLPPDVFYDGDPTTKTSVRRRDEESIRKTPPGIDRSLLPGFWSCAAARGRYGNRIVPSSCVLLQGGASVEDLHCQKKERPPEDRSMKNVSRKRSGLILTARRYSKTMSSKREAKRGLSDIFHWKHCTLLNDRVSALGIRPVLVFINLKSGPCAGADLRNQCLRLLHPLQVACLPKQRPEDALRFFSDVKGLRILVAGGDGTVSWILSCLDDLAREKNGCYPCLSGVEEEEEEEKEAKNPTHHRKGTWVQPPVAVLPLGTGNDLAQCLGWGGGITSHKPSGISEVLSDLNKATVSLLDRWTIDFVGRPRIHEEVAGTGVVVQKDGFSKKKHALGSNPPKKEEEKTASSLRRPIVMNNYMGIGVDARIALQFHSMRLRYPHWFQSRFGNKLYYAGMGAKDLLFGSSRVHHHEGAEETFHGASSPVSSSHHDHLKRPLHRVLRLLCDGREIAVPKDIDGLLILNIPSYMGGVNLWGSYNTVAPVGNEREETYTPASYIPPPRTPTTNGSKRVWKKQSMCDGVIEVVGVYGVWHLGRMQVGLSNALRLAQARSITIQFRNNVVDDDGTEGDRSLVGNLPSLRDGEVLPVQIDGEPFVLRADEASALRVTLQGQAVMLAKGDERDAARRAVFDVLDWAWEEHHISTLQHDLLRKECAKSMHGL